MFHPVNPQVQALSHVRPAQMLSGSTKRKKHAKKLNESCGNMCTLFSFWTKPCVKKLFVLSTTIVSKQFYEIGHELSAVFMPRHMKILGFDLHNFGKID